MRTLLCLLLLGALGAPDLEAQRRRDRDRDDWGWGWWRRDAPAEFGVRGGYDFDDAVGSAGAQLRLPLIRQLLLVPSADVFFGDDATRWQLNADAVLRPDELGGLYAGAGAGFASRDFDGDDDEEVETGFNVLVGLDGARVLDTRLRPFVEARWTDTGAYQPFRLVAGVNVPLR